MISHFGSTMSKDFVPEYIQRPARPVMRMEPMPVDFTRKWIEPAAEIAYVHPKPVISMREAEGDEICLGARKVIKAAKAAGWQVRTTYALGFTLPATRSPSHLVHSVAVRLASADGKYRAVATWQVKADETASTYFVPTSGWKADEAFIWAVKEIPFRTSVTVLATYLIDQERGMAQAVIARFEAEAAKEAAKLRPKKTKAKSEGS